MGVDGPIRFNLFEAGLVSGSVCSAAFRFLEETTVMVTKGAEARCLDLRPNNDTTYICTEYHGRSGKKARRRGKRVSGQNDEGGGVEMLTGWELSSSGEGM